MVDAVQVMSERAKGEKAIEELLGQERVAKSEMH